MAQAKEAYYKTIEIEGKSDRECFEEALKYLKEHPHQTVYATYYEWVVLDDQNQECCLSLVVLGDHV